ncbi:putative aminopeptidase [Pisolithus marmoratus]|nr:putative aminopeptidase [Pisolithus marmoratus]
MTERATRLPSPPRVDALVTGIVHGTSAENIRKGIRYLTDEDRTLAIAPMHSFPGSSRAPAKWLKTQFEYTGAACRFTLFLEGLAFNVFRYYTHYDSHGSFGMEQVGTRRNNDASGTIPVLSITRRIKQTGMTFRSNAELVVFAVTNRFYWGQRHTLASFTELQMICRANLTLMVPVNVLAYHAPDEFPQLG